MALKFSSEAWDDGFSVLGWENNEKKTSVTFWVRIIFKNVEMLEFEQYEKGVTYSGPARRQSIGQIMQIGRSFSDPGLMVM